MSNSQKASQKILSGANRNVLRVLPRSTIACVERPFSVVASSSKNRERKKKTRSQKLDLFLRCDYSRSRMRFIWLDEVTMLQTFQAIKSLGCGATIIAGVLGLLQLFVPQLFPANAPLVCTLLVGALLGAGMGALARPIRDTAGFYFRLTELCYLRKLGLVTRASWRRLFAAMADAHFKSTDTKQNSAKSDPDPPENPPR